jgi:hypothetical protein
MIQASSGGGGGGGDMMSALRERLARRATVMSGKIDKEIKYDTTHSRYVTSHMFIHSVAMMLYVCMSIELNQQHHVSVAKQV